MAEPMQLQSLVVDDFSGGMTDRYIAARPNQFQLADNFVIRNHGGKGKLRSRPGSSFFDSNYPQIPGADVRLVDIEEHELQIFQFSAQNIYYISSGMQTLTGPTGNAALSSGDVTNYLSKAKWNKHLLVCNDAFSQPVKVFNDGSWRVRALGLPRPDTSLTTITPSTPSTKSYVYAFIRSDSYSIGTITYREVSAVSQIEVTNSSEPSVHQNNIANIPTLSNSSTGNYNTTGLKVEIYRTTDGGTTLYKVGEVTNGTTTFSDTMSDANVILQEQLYTTGGVVDYEQVDPAKYVTICNDCAWYMNTSEDGVQYPNRVRQSIQGALYASPRDFTTDLDSPILGGRSVGIYPIVFCESGRIYRLEGVVDDQGTGSTEAREIARTVKLLSNRSIVEAKGGLFFAADSGFYFTDGYQVQKISEEIPDTYSTMTSTDNQKSRIYGTYNRFEERIEWATQQDSASNDNDSIFVAHLKWGISASTPFTTWSGGPDFVDNFAPTCLLYPSSGYLLRGDRRGYLFEHKETYLSDLKIDTSSPEANWYSTRIYPDYRSTAFDFGTTTFRKWVPEIIIMADNLTNVAMRIFSNNDNGGVFKDLAEIVYSSVFVWGDTDFVWGDPPNSSFKWNYATIIDAWRRFPAQGLRCNYKQIKIAPSYTVIQSSSTLGTASSDGSTKIITLDNSAHSYTPDPIDYYISFDDNSDIEFKIIGRPSDTTILVSDLSNQLSTIPSRSWKIKGYRKSQKISLIDYEIRYSILSRTQKAYRP